MSLRLNSVKQITECTEKVKKIENGVKEIKETLERGERLQLPLQRQPQQLPLSPDLEKMNEEFISLSPLNATDEAAVAVAADEYDEKEDYNTLDGYFLAS
jgi:hypothetical protein